MMPWAGQSRRCSTMEYFLIMAKKTPRIGGAYIASLRTSSQEEQPMLTTPVEAPPRPNIPSLRDYRLMTRRPDFAEERLVHRTPTTLLRRLVPVTVVTFV